MSANYPKDDNAARELIVLVDDAGSPIGTMKKSDVHHADTPLHLAFSVFLFNGSGELLLQQRAHSKKTWPGVWSNSCCGHPLPDEPITDAAARRLKFELGIDGVDLRVMLPDFRYRAEKDGIVENEICPVLVGWAEKVPRPNPDEVADIKWIAWSEFLRLARDRTSGISPWAAEEARLLAAHPAFAEFFGEVLAANDCGVK